MVDIGQPPVAGRGENEFASVILANRAADGIDCVVVKGRLPVVAVGYWKLYFPPQPEIQRKFLAGFPVILQIYAVEPRTGHF